MVLWYPGGQLGHIFVGDRYYIDKPLTLISTWDGDELSIIRTHEHLRAAHRLETMEPAATALRELLQHLFVDRFPGASLGGAGLYQTVRFSAPATAAAIVQVSSHKGVFFGSGRPGTIIAAPPLDIEAHVIATVLRRTLEPLIDNLLGGGSL
jgi:acetylornithine/succinyldiaminopimelate/putrescine aminotransferase